MNKQCYGCFEDYNESLSMCPHCGYEDGEGPEEALHLEPGRRLKEIYIVGKVLGYGGFGVTYLAWNTVLEQKVAIKEYLPSEFSTRMPGQTKVTVFNGDKAEQFHDGIDKFVEEANRLAQFRNTEGIVKIFESFKENNTAYIVMEYLDGETLTKYLEKTGQLSTDEAIRLMTPIIQSLQAVHEQGVIHRDIAPDNIMITKDGRVKLIDFGAARYATTSRSRSLTIVIKPGYSPEEQYRSRGDQGSWTDVYAVGATMYRMITGQTPPDAMERRASFEGKKKDILSAISKHSKQTNANQEVAIFNAMNIRIEDRTPDMGTFEQELNSQDEVKRRTSKIKKIDVLKWPLWAKISLPTAVSFLLIFSILLGIGAIGFDANLRENIDVPEGMTRVPSVVSSEISKAEARLTESKLFCSIIGKEYSDDIPADLILKQDLAAGSIVPSNSELKIEISGGKVQSEEQLTQTDENGNLSVADVQYRTKEEAIRLLKLQGMTIKIVEQSSETIAAGVVISQNPKVGTKLAPGTEVTLTVSTGDTRSTKPMTTSTPPTTSIQTNPSEEMVTDYSYTINGNNVTITKYKGNGGIITIPSTIEGKSVTKIGDNAFYECSRLTNLTIPNGVKSIGGSAFASCKGLKSVTIPSSITSIADRAFVGCSGLNSIVIPNGIKKIDDLMFAGCSSLTSITLPNSVTTIGVQVFYECTNLKQITLPSSITSIEGYAFAGCSGLVDIAIPSNVTSIGSYAFYECSSLKNITIPSSVKNIGEWAFNRCSNLIATRFEGNAPTVFGVYVFAMTSPDFKIYYHSGKSGWSNPWNGYTTQVINTPSSSVPSESSESSESPDPEP